MTAKQHMELLPLFGRSPSLEYLKRRVREPGLTAIVGKPKQGKSHLLRELRRQLERTDFLTGYFEANKTETDTVLYAVSDLYERWLADSSWRQQAASLYETHKCELATGAAAAVGDVLLEAAKDLNMPLAGTARKIFENFLRANHDLKTGSLELPPLTSAQVMNILSPLHAITGKSIVLIFDAWERSGRIAEDVDFLESFLDHWHNWPPMHVLVACREHTTDGKPFTPTDRLVGRSVKADRWRLPLMTIDEDSAARRNLLEYLHYSKPFTKEIPDTQIVDLIGGYPGVLQAWFDSSPKTIAELQELAAEAQQGRYDQFLNVALPSLLHDGAASVQFRLLVRLAMLPELNRPDEWQQLKPAVLADFSNGNDLLNQLTSRGLLVRGLGQENRDVPRFGHTTKYDVARKWFLSDPRAVPHTCSQASVFLLRLASRIRSIDDQDIYCARALARCGSIIETLGLGAPFRAIFTASRTLFGHRDDKTCDYLLASATSVAAMTPSPRGLLAVALCNELNHAKEEKDLPRRDALLDELRDLYKAHSEFRGRHT